MNITLSGSLGHISKPLAQQLIQQGHQVTVISSQANRQKDIEALGASAAIGTIEDVNFLTRAFTGADAVYCMLPPPNFFDLNFDLMASLKQISNNYKQAILQAGVKKVIHLSSIGAHTDTGNGMLRFHYQAEHIFRELPADVAITHLRPVAFYYNLHHFAHAIKTQGVIASNYGADDVVAWVSPTDIAAVAAEELTVPASGVKVRYIASDEPSCNQIASTLGAAIGKPDLQWIVIPDEQLLSGLLAAGMNPDIAKGYIDMNAAMHNGALFEDYYRNRPAILGKIKIADFAKEFAANFNS